MRNALPTIFVALTAIGVLASCDPTPIQDTVNARLETFVGDEGAKERFLSEIRAETDRVDAAFWTLEDTDVSDALIEARDNGAEVRVVTDTDRADSAGIVALKDAGIEVVELSGEFSYLPDPNLSPILGDTDNAILREGTTNEMTHTFAILGEVTVWHFASPFLENRTPRIGYRVVSQLLREDFSREFRQLFARVNAIELDIYNGPTKSLVHKHPYETLNGDPFFYSDSLYTDQGRLRLLFNPQNRAIKTLIDEIYRSQASVFIQTNSLEEPFVLEALEYKDAAGFDVRVAVNSNAQIDDDNQNARLQGLDANFVDAEYLPTVVIFDESADRFGRARPRQAMVISHDVMRVSPFEVVFNPDGNDTVNVFKSDFFADGHAWMAVEVNGQRGQVEVIDGLLEEFNSNYGDGQ